MRRQGRRRILEWKDRELGGFDKEIEGIWEDAGYSIG